MHQTPLFLDHVTNSKTDLCAGIEDERDFAYILSVSGGGQEKEERTDKSSVFLLENLEPGTPYIIKVRGLPPLF